MTPKYQIGQEVWRIQNRKAIEELIIGLVLPNKKLKEVVYYVDSSERFRDGTPTITGWIQEELLFPSREELIKSL